VENIRQIVSWQRDWFHPSSAAVDRRHQLLASCSQTMQERGDVEIQQARLALAHIISRFAAPYEAVFDLEMSVSLATRLTKLLARAETFAHDPTHLRRLIWFQAMSLFDLSLGLAFLERVESLESASEDLEGLLDLLEREFFSGTFEEKIVTVYHDPTDDYRVCAKHGGKGWENHPQLLVAREHRVVFRQTRFKSPVLVGHRVKPPFSTLLKIMRQTRDGETDPLSVRDRRALRFVARDEADATRAVGFLREALHRSGGDLTERVCVPQGQVCGCHVRQDNRHSDDRFKARRFSLVWRGKLFELQVMVMEDYLNSVYSVGPENHRLYRLRQMLDVYLRFLLPSSIYGVRWRDAEVSQKLRTSILGPLGWPA
jgi:hypothetical protein